MRSSAWKKIINSTQDLNSKWIEYKKSEIGLGPSTWYYDQWITTHGLLYRKICNVPPESGLWDNKNLDFDPDFDDSKQCWHGKFYKDCNIDIHIVGHGCKWFHFFPFQTFEEHVEKFRELTQDEYNIDLKSIF